MSPKPLDVLILGGGVSGLTTALALTKFAPEGAVPNITVYEIRDEPATVGGAVNLTPNSLRLLDHLGVLKIMKDSHYGITVDAVEIFDIHGGSKLGESGFRGPNNTGLGHPPYKALRITRGSALKALLETVIAVKSIKLVYGKKTVSIDETDKSVTLNFKDGTKATGDMLMGCDGIHSVARTKHVDPERIETYTGIANAFGFAPLRKGEKMHFDSTAINLSRRGMLLTSFYEETQSSIYVGALMEVPEVGSRDGWKAKGADEAAIKKDIIERFGGSAIKSVEPLTEDAEGWFLWPIYTLSKGGKWATNRTMLLGDAAHAMPPQGESTGIVLEDTILFARCIATFQEKGNENLKEAFDAYEKLRRSRIDVAYEESKNVVKTVQDAGWLGHFIKTLIVPWFLWWTRSYREKHFIEDVTTSDLGIDS